MSDLFAPVLKHRQKSSQATFEGPNCFSSSLRNTTAGEKLSHEFIVFFISTLLACFPIEESEFDRVIGGLGAGFRPPAHRRRAEQ